MPPAFPDTLLPPPDVFNLKNSEDTHFPVCIHISPIKYFQKALDKVSIKCYNVYIVYIHIRANQRIRNRFAA